MPTREQSTTPGPIALDSVEILLVDDDRPWARTTARLLAEGRSGFAVETAHSLAEGRARFAECDPDCVVADYQLGDGTGLDLLEAVRAVDADRPFVLVTGRGSEAVASEAIDGGVTDYIRKGHDDGAADRLGGRIANAVRTYRTERAFERERRSKDAMLDILTETRSRADLSRQFCTQLVEGRGLDCAWIGTDEGGGRIVPTVSAGDDAYLDERGVPTDRSSAEEAPAVIALDRDEPVVAPIHDADGPEGDAGWQGAARRHGFEVAAALPIRHDGVRFGVLAVYAGDAAAVDERELHFLEEYADTIGYALRNAEMKRSLLADRPVRVDVAITDETAPLIALADRLEPRARIDVVSALDRGDGSTLLLVTVGGAPPSVVREEASSLEGVSVHDVDTGTDPMRFDLQVTNPTPEAVVAAHGARFERTVVDRGTATVTALVPDDGSVGALTDALGAVYDSPDVTRIWSHRTRREAGSTDDPLAELTERQREVVSYAFHHGYYEQPRGISATELADAFDLARATLTQHLRTAERRVLQALLEN